jgi:phosphoribosylamine-glycine ligase
LEDRHAVLDLALRSLGVRREMTVLASGLRGGFRVVIEERRVGEHMSWRSLEGVVHFLAGMLAHDGPQQPDSDPGRPTGGV